MQLSVQLCQLAPFCIGTAIKDGLLATHPLYRDRALGQFNSFTPERVLKAAHIHPAEKRFDFQDADKLVELCNKNKKRLHGHTLVWDRDLPPWLRAIKHKNSSVLDTHITALVSRYKGRISGWDVVNEAFNKEGHVKKGVWYRIGGKHFIEHAFRTAEAADPKCPLFYNDFDLEYNPVKRQKVLLYLQHLRTKGCRIDGIGLQMHLNVHDAFSLDFYKIFKEISSQGFKIHLSELDISLQDNRGSPISAQQLLNRQAALLQKITAAYLRLPPASRYGITFWGVSDKDSWLYYRSKKKDAPLLFDQEYRPKPCWHTITAFLKKKNPAS